MEYKKEEITKSYYENTPFNFLKRNLPAVILISGEEYQKFTEKFQKPYDSIFLSSMQNTLVYMCSQIPGCIMGYTKEFDMTIIFNSPSNIETPSWYNFDINKITTLTASMATLKFNKTFEKSAKTYVMSGNNFDETRKFTAMQGYVSAIEEGALFTSKTFNIQPDQIADYLFLQQKQTIDNAVHEMGLEYFKEAELADKSSSDIQFMVFDKSGINFDSYPSEFKRGTACVKNTIKDGELISPLKEAGAWVIDKHMPLLKPGSRSYIEEVLKTP